jgi:broad specificity phosphatase PhoE
MRVVEHRRHSRRDPAGVHLSEDGVALARTVARTLGRFDRVVSSPKLRAIETVEALGLSIDATVPELAVMPDGAGVPVDELSLGSFAEYVRAVERNETLARYARSLAERMREELKRLPEGGRLLMISHAGVVESSAAASCPRDALRWGPLAAPLEGVRLYLEGGRWARGEVVRVSP